ncbi:hypothetical protein F5880DRAFT_1509907 [Lentinula raphanica]|nr:hypothetical protein F5880DRAFT_1509907 [Lentinula raphanica]
MAEADQAGLSLPESYFLSIFCEGIFHGMYTTIFCSAMYLLLQKRRRKGLTNMIMTTLTVFMYIMSTVHLALSLRMNLVALFKQKAADGQESLYDDQGSPLYFGQVAIEVINCVLGDSIVTWRTWVLWARDWKMIYLPCLLMLGSSGSVMVYEFSLSPPGQPNFSNTTTIWFSIFGGFSFLTNLYAVVVILIKTWLHRRKMSRLCVDVVVNGPRFYSALFMIIESGGIYCLAVSSNVVIIVADMLAHLTGIYPTIIIVLMTRKEATLATMQFQRGGQVHLTGGPLTSIMSMNELGGNQTQSHTAKAPRFNTRPVKFAMDDEPGVHMESESISSRVEAGLRSYDGIDGSEEFPLPGKNYESC